MQGQSEKRTFSEALIHYGYVILACLGVVVILVTYLMELMTGMTWPHDWYNSWLAGMGILIIIAGVVMQFWERLPGTIGDLCFQQWRIIFPATPILPICWLIVIPNPTIFGFSYSYPSPYTDSPITIALIATSIIVFYFSMMRAYKDSKPFRHLKYNEVRFKAEGRTVEDFSSIVLSKLNTYDRFELVRNKMKGGRIQECVIAGWIGGREEKDRTGVTVTVRGKQSRLAIKIELGNESSNRLQEMSDELGSKLGFVNR